MEPSDTAPSPLPEDDGTLPFEKDVGASLSLADVPLPGTADNSFPAYDPADDTYDESMLPNDSIMALPADIPPMPEGSMPTPREHRQSDPARNARMTFICRISVILMSVLLFVVALTFLLARVSRGNDTTTTPKTAAPTAPPLEDIAAYLTTHGASSLTELMTPNTPQNLALHWLAVGDPAPEAVPDVGISEPEGYLYVVRYVMAVHYFSLNGDDWTKTTGFLTGNHVCDWNGYSFSFDNSGGIENGGLSCDAESKMPNILDLEFNNLSGEIPTEIGLLTSLEFLDFEYNAKIGGTLPTELCRLTNLETIGMRQNVLKGSLPACFGQLDKLQTLFLSNNQLQGKLSSQLCSMTSLQNLHLHSNRLSGAIPDCVGQWSQVETVLLSDNQLTGSLPSGIQEWKNNLEALWLFNNDMTGSLPTGIDQWTAIQELYISYNRFKGELPADLSRWTEMTSFIVSRNDFTGRLPSGMGKWTGLEYLVLSNNDITGPLPTELTITAPTLSELFLDDNYFEGNPLAVLNQLKNLRLLYLENNLFDGNLDDGFLDDLSNLAALDISANNFTSHEYAIPPHIFQKGRLQVLDMSDNNLGGRLPTAIPQNGILHFLSVHDNQIVDEIPTALSNLTRLLHLDLASNDFEGPMTEELFTYGRLQHLFLSENPGLDPGPIPTGLESMTQLSELSLKNTNRNGPLPELDEFTSLLLLDLDNNRFTGKVPSNYGNLERLRYLLLNRNPISGELPAFGKTKDLRTILLDGTNLTGDFSTICSLPVFSLGANHSNSDVVAVADCGDLDSAVNCTCCYCCYDSEVTATSTCSDPLVASLDWSWESGYRRQARDFGLDLSSLAASPDS